MYKNEIRLDDTTAEQMKEVVNKKKITNKKYSINDFIEKAIKEKLERESK